MAVAIAGNIEWRIAMITLSEVVQPCALGALIWALMFLAALIIKPIFKKPEDSHREQRERRDL